MTNLEAIRYYIEPYEVSEGKLEILLAEQGLQTTANYDPIADKSTMYTAVIAVLTSLITLKKEKDNGSEMDYDTDALQDLIGYYRKQLDDTITTKPQNRDITSYW